MTPFFIEPTQIEIRLTLALGLTILSPYYRSFAENLDLNGNESVLDFGSGSGVCSRHIASRLQKNRGKLTCVDISSVWQRVIKKTLRRFKNVSYLQGLIYELAIPDSSYDVIVIHFVLHDIPTGERGQVMQALTRKLKSGGCLVVREPLGEGITLENLFQLTQSSGLQLNALKTDKVFIGQVLDGAFTKKVLEVENAVPQLSAYPTDSATSH